MTGFHSFAACLGLAIGLAAATEAEAVAMRPLPNGMAGNGSGFGAPVALAAHRRRTRRVVRPGRVVVVNPFFGTILVKPAVEPRKEIYPAYGYPVVVKRRR